MLTIRKASAVDIVDPCHYGWSELRRFQNVPYSAELMCEIHQAPTLQAKNVNKQAKHLQHCLALAREYHDASRSVSMATKPVLLYYSIMNLAIAEILFKQTGDSSLDRARAEHRHHGLTAHIAAATDPHAPLQASAASLVAKPLVAGNGCRRGTFEMWHRTCREAPLVARVEDKINHTIGYRAVLGPADTRMPCLPEIGISLLKCLRNLPGLAQFIGSHEVSTDLVRGSCKVDVNTDSKYVYKFVIHPSHPQTLQDFCESIILHPSLVNSMNVHEYRNGIGFSITVDDEHPEYMSTPECYPYDKEDIYFSSQKAMFNEFGYLYVAFFILGSYARYYPDKWIKDIEEFSSLSLAAERLVSEFDRRVPLLALCEFRREYLIAR